MSSLMCWILYIMVTLPSGTIMRQAVLLSNEEECTATGKAYFAKLKESGYKEPQAYCKQAISI